MRLNFFISILGIFYSGIHNFPYLVASRHPLGVKIKIILTWLRINFKFIVLSKVARLNNETIFGYKISAFEYSSIRFLYEEIFYRNEYYFASESNQPIIIDGGANIGLATIYFKWLFPFSEVHAFEPDEETFKLLKKNVEQNNLKNVHLYQAALANTNGHLKFYIDKKNPGSLTMSTRPNRLPKDMVVVKCLALSSVIQNQNIPRIDFLKLDIEGSETGVIQDLSHDDLLTKVSKSVIEYHHNISGEKSRLGEFLRVLENNGFEYQINAAWTSFNDANKFQDILLNLHRGEVSSG